MTGSRFVPSIKNIVREICISSCDGKYPDRGNDNNNNNNSNNNSNNNNNNNNNNDNLFI